MWRRFASDGPQRIIAAERKVRRKPMPRSWQVRYFNPRFAISCGLEHTGRGGLYLVGAGSAANGKPLCAVQQLVD
jgi:hypothetical protein